MVAPFARTADLTDAALLVQFCALSGSLSPWLPRLTSLRSLNLAANQARLPAALRTALQPDGSH